MNGLAPILETILRNALDTTQAASGWIVARDGDRFSVAVAGGDGVATVGQEVAPGSSAAFCIATGEPAARQPRAGDASADGAGGYPGVPPNLLTVPCFDETAGSVGALELAGKPGGPFTIDDIELVSILASVAGTAIAHGDAAAPELVASPDELGSGLARLAAADAHRYAVVARAVSALLGPEAA